MKKIDAAGLSCPEPVILTKRAIEDNPKEIEVKVDNNVSKENVKRFLESNGYKVTIQEKDEDILIYGKK